MISIVAEKGMVKLVHPGRYVEILREPITAGEVMSKNPRHCITRPDVFKYPWVVINPGSVLPPGKVFFLVPDRTVYDLMKSENNRKRRNRAAAPPKTTRPYKAFAGMTPKHQGHGHHYQINPRLIQRNSNEGAGSGSEEIAPRRSGSDGGEEFSSPWLGRKNSYWEFRRQLLSETAQLKPNYSRNGGDHGGSSSVSCRRDREESATATLKSCLRKADSDRKSLRLKVSFVLPTRLETARVRRKSASTERRARVSDFVNW